MSCYGLHPHIVQGVQTTKRVDLSKCYTWGGEGTVETDREGKEIVEMLTLHRFADRMRVDIVTSLHMARINTWARWTGDLLGRLLHSTYMYVCI